MLIFALCRQLREMRSLLGLFEGVVSGAAAGYARMTGKPACTLLHLGPGFANGLANLHNANRAQVPIVNVVGQHATYHLRHDTPLTSDIEAVPRPYSKWLRSPCSASQIGCDAAEAIVAARTPPGRVATLIVPADVAWSEGGIIAEARDVPSAPLPDDQTIERAAGMLKSGLRIALLIAGSGLYGKGLQAAGRIAAATNASLLCPYPFMRMERGAGKPRVERVHYILEQAVDQLKEFRQLILVGPQAPVAYFAAPGKNAVLTSPECEILRLASPGEDCAGALDALASALPVRGIQPHTGKQERPLVPGGDITLSGIASAVGALLPENAIVVDESMTSGRALIAATRGSPPHDWLANTGGSIGIALPLAVGAAGACADRRGLCVNADGRAMFTKQARLTLWRQGLNIPKVVFANRAYAVLKREFSYLRVGNPGPRALDMFEIGRPDLDWVFLAKSMGVPGTRVSSLEDFARALREGFEGGGPMLIEVRL